MRWLLAVAATVVLVSCVRAFVVVPVRITSSSMEPTLEVGDVVLISRDAPEVVDLHRGDLVVFDDPVHHERTIKRVAGLPGEQVVILDDVLHVDGRPIHEPWVGSAGSAGSYSRAVTVGDGEVFVLGDDRDRSEDSRDYGPVDAGDLTGRVVTTLWSADAWPALLP